MLRKLLMSASIVYAFLLISCGGGGGSDDPAPASGSTSYQLDASARFNRPGDISADQSGNLYVMDRGNRAIRKIATNGEVSTLASQIDERTRMASEPSGSLLIVSGSAVSRISSSGATTLLKDYGSASDSYMPLSVASDALGNVYVLLRYRNIFRIERIDAEEASRFVYYLLNYGYNSGLASDASGNLATIVVSPEFEATGTGPTYIEYVPLEAQIPNANHSSGISRFQIEYAYIPGHFGSMSFDRDGNLYVAGGAYVFDASTRIYTFRNILMAQITPDGTMDEIYNGFPDGIDMPRPVSENEYTSIGVVVAADGKIYLSDPFSSAVYRIEPSGSAVLVAGKPGEIGYSD